MWQDCNSKTVLPESVSCFRHYTEITMFRQSEIPEFMQERTALACVFLDRIEEAGYTGMFYAARSELEDSLLWDTKTLEQRYRIWVAQYLPEAYPEIQGLEYGGSFAMWQYTDGGTVPRIRTWRILAMRRRCQCWKRKKQRSDDSCLCHRYILVYINQK